MTQRRIIIIELDGASWNVLQPLVSKGRLPNLARLRARGASGTLLSDPPLISPRLWVSIFSGKRSAKHGVEFFGSSSSMVRCKRLWDIFSDRGHPVGIFGTFVTWPPSPVKGFMIPSLFALGPETWPEEYRFLQELTLAERAKGKQGMAKGGRRHRLMHYAARLAKHGVSIRTLWGAGAQVIADRLIGRSGDDRYWRRGAAHLRITAEVFAYLLRRYQPVFSSFHIHLCDAVAHRYWKYYEPEKFPDVDARHVERYRNVVPASYEEADRAIGRILAASPGATVMVVSDHGSEAMETSRTSYRLHVEHFLERFGLRDIVIPAHIGLMTFCFFRDSAMLEHMRQVFEEVRFSDTGESVFDVMTEESLLGLRLSQKFWGTEIPGERTMELGHLGTCLFSELFLPEKMAVSGNHSREGIVIMAGSGIRQDVRLSDASIFDVAPTVLAVAGLPVAQDMDGSVIEEALTESFLGENPIRVIPSYENPEDVQGGEQQTATYDQVKAQLESLGYL